MPRVEALPGLGYAIARYAREPIPARIRLAGDRDGDASRIADLTDVVCPPYDVIGDADRQRLLERDPHNAVRLELNPEADAHRAAAHTLAAWRSDGTLESHESAMYTYAWATAAAPDRPSVHGLLARVLLEPWGSAIRRHEHTMAAPKADRLGLLRATRTQLSPILMLYFDPSARPLVGAAEPTAEQATAEWRARDAGGLLHRVAAFGPLGSPRANLAAQRLFVADGHHRYETALAYQAEVRSRTPHRDAPAGSLSADWIMAVLVNAEREALEIRPTHRLVRGVSPVALRELVAGADGAWHAEPVPPKALTDRLRVLRDDPAPLFGLVLGEGEGYLLRGPGARDDDPVARLDLSVLHRAILASRLGMAPNGADGDIRYTTDPAEAIRATAEGGDMQAAFLVRPTRLAELAAVANAGTVMPHKSTYFYPKLLTGMLFNPVED